MTPTLPIVGIGASAGGVEALEEFFKAVPANSGLAFVVVTHLSRDRESMLAEFSDAPLTCRLSTPATARGSRPSTPTCCRRAALTIEEGKLRLRRTGPDDRERAPIDVFFNSLAEDQREHAIGVVLSGGGHDGTLGIKAIKENGGLTIAQGSNVSRPRFAEMPSSAVAAGFVDLELPVEEIPARIIAYVRNWGAFDPEKPGNALVNIHNLLRTRTGHDFSEYKERTFQRRVQRRMQVVQTTKLEDYAERLQKDPNEVQALFRDLLIGVTDFFRDATAFQSLETSTIPKLFEGKGADDEVRVWVAGCSTGEEAYSLAILLREQCEKLLAPPKVQIFATDIDEMAMGTARAARYLANVVKEVSPERLRRFFVHEGGSYRVVKELRDMCIFSTHSVIRDPPFSRLDLISCRNLLIYLKPTLQAQIIPLFHYSLRPGGFLFLGSSENLSRYSELFISVDRKNRVFRRRDLVSRPPLPLRQFLPNSRRDRSTEEGQSGLLQRSNSLRRVAAAVVERFAPTFVIVDEAGQTLFFSSGTGKYLQPAAGPPNRDVIAMARPGLRADLRAALHRAKETGQRIVRDRIAVEVDGGTQMISVAVERISEGNETAYGVVFTDHGPVSRAEEAAAARPDGEDATVRQIEKELQETKERLQSTIEELETANEEFRSSNEELISVNEELQSTNEELETSKEELQSVNEELQTVNNELSIKIDELDRANADLNNLFQSTQIATIFLDRNLVIRSFTPAITKLFALIPNDRGRPLADIVSRIEYPELAEHMRRVCDGEDEVTERSVTVAGGNGHYLARILPYRGPNSEIDGVLLTFVDITNIVAAEEQQKVLAAELSHRVKNTLAVVSSIAERSLPDGEAKQELLGRFHALGYTHDLLSQTGWTEASLREVISTELAPHIAGDGANIVVSGPQVMLKPQPALLLALVFHELATNAAKYGALSTSGGRVEISWTLAGSRPTRLELIWTESGGPKFDGFPTRGFGTELIERGIRFELQGEAKLTAVDGGLQCRIILPVNPQNMTFGSPREKPTTEEAAS